MKACNKSQILSAGLDERTRRIFAGASAGGIERLVGIAISLVTVPLTLNYLGEERYGLWLAVTSAVAFLSFGDMGISNVVISRVASASTDRKKTLAAQFICSAFILLTLAAMLLMVLATVLIMYLPWESILNFDSTLAITEIRPTLFIVTTCFLLRIPLSLGDRIRMGMQQTHIISLWQTGGNVLMLLGLVIVIDLGLGLPWLALALAGIPVLASAGNFSVLVWSRRRRWATIRYPINCAICRGIVTTGLLFLGMQISHLFAHQTDALVVSHMLGADTVPDYAVPMKLFMYGPMIIGLMLRPLWPAYGDSIAKGDHVWVTTTLKRSIVLSLCFILPFAIVALAMGPQLLRVWVGPAIDLKTPMSLALGAFVIISVTISAITKFQSGAKVFRFQFLCSISMAIVNLPLSIFLTYLIGVSGVVWGSVISRLLFVLVPAMVFMPTHLRLIESRRLKTCSRSR